MSASIENKRTGKALESLIYYFERSLAQYPDVKIETRKKFRDKETGRLREFDVVLTYKQNHHEIIIAIECRDRSRPVTVNQVEGFSAKCEAVNLHYMVIVSSKGFYKSARIKAEMKGIKCFDLEQATSLDWLVAESFNIINKIIKSMNMAVVLHNHIGKLDFSDVMFYDENGVELNQKHFLDTAGKAIDNYLETERDLINTVSELEQYNQKYLKSNSEYALLVNINFDNLTLIKKETKEKLTIKSMVIEVKYEIQIQKIPLLLFKYEDKEKSGLIASAAVTSEPFELDGKKEKVMFLHDGKGIKLVLLSEK